MKNSFVLSYMEKHIDIKILIPIEWGSREQLWTSTSYKCRQSYGVGSLYMYMPMVFNKF